MVRRLDENPTVPERSLRIWQILASKAMNRQTMTFTELTQILNFGGDGAGLHHSLNLLNRYCQSNDLYYLTILVVRVDTGEPGEGYPGDRDRLNVDRERVFNFPWFSIAPPTLEQLEQAYRED